MPIPDYQTLYMPLLRFAADEKEHNVDEAMKAIADSFSLTDDERRERIPSGTQSLFANRVQWAKTYLAHAGCLASARRGVFCITERGLALLKQSHERITNKVLSQFPEFVQFHEPTRRKPTQDNTTGDNADGGTPEEKIEAAYGVMQRELADQLLQKVKEGSPEFFEQLVVDLMVAMGYGGSREDAAQSIGRTGDEGIDGIIKEDRLGLGVIYLQAKRWAGTVGRPEIHKFVGALIGQHAQRGVFITTGRFSAEAVEFARTSNPVVILIDGSKLVQYMIESGLGTTLHKHYDIRKIDSDYFAEE